MEALQKQPGAGEKNKTQRDLHEHQSRAQSRSPAATNHSTALAFERDGEVDISRLDRGHEREKHCRFNTDRDAEKKNAPIQLDVIINCNPGQRWRKREYEGDA